MEMTPEFGSECNNEAVIASEEIPRVVSFSVKETYWLETLECLGEAHFTHSGGLFRIPFSLAQSWFCPQRGSLEWW